MLLRKGVNKDVSKDSPTKTRCSVTTFKFQFSLSENITSHWVKISL